MAFSAGFIVHKYLFIYVWTPEHESGGVLLLIGLCRTLNRSVSVRSCGAIKYNRARALKPRVCSTRAALAALRAVHLPGADRVAEHAHGYLRAEGGILAVHRHGA